MSKRVMGNIPKIFRFYTAPYPYILSASDLFELTTQLAWYGKLYYGWSRKLLEFVDTVPPSFTLANPKGDQGDFVAMVEKIFFRVIDDENYLTEAYAHLFARQDFNDRLIITTYDKGQNFSLRFMPPNQR